MTAESDSGVDLYWLPLGAGGHSVRLNGRVFEAVVARLERRPPSDLYHSALEVRVPEGRFVIEQTPVPDRDGQERGVVAEGAVGSRWAGRFRIFRYEVRRWCGGTIPDADEAVQSPQRLTDDPERAQQVLDAAGHLPTPVWGRDELRAGEMWNSNSVISWLLVRGGFDIDSICLPAGGRAPGWRAGIVVARRHEKPLDAARDAFDAEFESGEKLGGPILRAHARSKLGIHADAEGRYGDALRLHMEATELFASIGDVGGIGATLSRASMSAYGLGDYPEALRLGTAGYEATSEVNHRWGTISALCRIGFAALALGDAADAGRRFSEALERAHGTQAVSLELHAISGIGAILAEDPAEQQRATVLLGFALGHEQLPAWYAAIARPALERLEGELPPELLAAAREEAAGMTLEEAVRIARQAVPEPVGSAAGS